jgi:S-DNA-T family DNA segregation ATPase FtsK/SpoIIIE
MGSKKKAPKQRTVPRVKFNLKDERWPKIIGVICLFFSLYLSVAFISYFYTWKIDQDKVLEFSWQVLFQGDLSVANWLGRFGALVSNAFFYWGFGLPSIVVIFLLIKLGIALVRKRSLGPFFVAAKYALIIMAFMSLALEFFLRSSEFTWGGAFGESTCYWLTNFVGQVGLFIMLMFSMLFFVVWQFNPNFDHWLSYLELPGIGKVDFDFFKSSNTSAKREKASSPNTQDTGISDNNENEKPYTALRPSHSSESAIPKTGGGVQEPRVELDVPELLSSQLKKKSKIDPSELEIEINVPVAKPSSSNEANEVPFMTVSAAEIAKEHATATAHIPATLNEKNFNEPYDPTLDLSKFKFPELEMLESYDEHKFEIDRSELEANKDQIIETLLNYKIEITKIRATIGPTVTLYEIIPAPGVKISKIKNLEDDIALSLAALGIRIIAPIPGKGTIGIEVPNKKKQIVSLKEVLKSDKFQNAKMDLPVALGKTISNEVFVADLAKMPHLLIAGATGQGKSVGINTVLMSLLYKKHPSQVKLVLIDPKKVELFPYGHLDQHYLGFLPNEDEPIVTETSKVIYTLNSLCIEMDQRYDLLKAARARNIKEYNEKFTSRKLNPKNGHKFLPYIVLVIDEFADLIMTAGKEVELPISRLAQLARAIGIHLVIATQRPSVNIITGVIKANFPARLAFKVTSKIDSRTILDQGGAEQLIGRGDMLLSIGSNLVRLQCAFVDTPEVERVIDHISHQQGYPEPFYLPEFKADEDISADGSQLTLSDLDDVFMDAARLVVGNQHGSTSMIQRKMQLGYNRAGRIMDQMEALGIVGPAQGSKPREVLFFSNEELENFLTNLQNK